MTPVILYHSRTGFTQQYAAWLSEDLRCPALPYRERGGIHWSKYDAVLFGSWFHAGSVMGKKWLKQQLPQWKEKHVILFVTGAAPAGEAQTAAMEQNFTSQEWAQMRAFYLPGGLRYERMGAVDRAMMAVYRKLLRAKEGPDSPAYQTICQSFDLADRAAIAPIVDYCRTF